MSGRLARLVATGLCASAVIVTLAGCGSADQQGIEAAARRTLRNPPGLRVSKAIVYRARDDVKSACFTVSYKNNWGERQPEQMYEAWYFFDRHVWGAGPAEGSALYRNCQEAVAAKIKTAGSNPSEPVPGSPLRPSTTSSATPIALSQEFYGLQPDQIAKMARLGDCHMETCSWSRVLVRTINGEEHKLRLLGGTTANGDEDPTHIKWNDEPHEATVTCSLVHPSVKVGDQVDELPLNASGSTVPGVLNSAYAVYAAECHPEAKDLDPDVLARRFGYRAKVDG